MQCIRYLPIGRRAEAAADIDAVTEALRTLAITGKEGDEVDQILAVAELGLCVAGGIVPATDELIRNTASLVRKTSTRQRALATLCALLRAGTPSVPALLTAIRAFLYGLMFNEPDEPARPIGRREPLRTRMVLGVLKRSGFFIRGLPPNLWLLAVIAWLTAAIYRPHPFLLSPYFWGLGLGLGWLAYHRTRHTGNAAFTFYLQILRPPIAVTSWAIRIGLVSILTAGRCLHRLACQLPAAVAAVARETVWLALSFGHALLVTPSAAAAALAAIIRSIGAVTLWLISVLRSLGHSDAVSEDVVPSRPSMPRSRVRLERAPDPPRARLEDREPILQALLAFIASLPARGVHALNDCVAGAASWFTRHRRLVATTVAVGGLSLVALANAERAVELYGEWRLRQALQALAASLDTAIHRGNQLHAGVSDFRSRARALSDVFTTDASSPSELLQRLEASGYADLKKRLAVLKAESQVLGEAAAEVSRQVTEIEKQWRQPGSALIEVQASMGTITHLSTTIDRELADADERMQFAAVARRTLEAHGEIVAALGALDARLTRPVGSSTPATEPAQDIQFVRQLQEQVTRWTGTAKHVLPASSGSRVADWEADLQRRARQLEAIANRRLAEAAPPPRPSTPATSAPPTDPISHASVERITKALAATAGQLTNLEREASKIPLVVVAESLPPAVAWNVVLHLDTRLAAAAQLARTTVDLDRSISSIEKQTAELKRRLPADTAQRYTPDAATRLSELRSRLAAVETSISRSQDFVPQQLPLLVELARRHPDQMMRQWRGILEDSRRQLATIQDALDAATSLVPSIQLLEEETHRLAGAGYGRHWLRGSRLSGRAVELQGSLEQLVAQRKTVDSEQGHQRLLSTRQEAERILEDAFGIARQPTTRRHAVDDAFFAITREVRASNVIRIADDTAEQLRSRSEQLDALLKALDSRTLSVSQRVRALVGAAAKTIGLVALATSVVLLPLGFLFTAWRKARRNRRYITAFDARKLLHDKRDYALVAVLGERLMAVRVAALRSLEDLGLSAQTDFEAIMRAQKSLEDRRRSGDLECAARLVAIAADVKMRMLRGA